MTKFSKWRKLLIFILLMNLSCHLKASLPGGGAVEPKTVDRCLVTRDREQACFQCTDLNYQHMQSRLSYLRFLLLQNSFTIQTYDYLWREHQRTMSCLEISRYIVAKAINILLCPATVKLPIPQPVFNLWQTSHMAFIQRARPPHVFSLRDPID